MSNEASIYSTNAAVFARELTAWGSSSCCCSAPKARGVAQAMPRHGQRQLVRHGRRLALFRTAVQRAFRQAALNHPDPDGDLAEPP